jgi:hypothetical protein
VAREDPFDLGWVDVVAGGDDQILAAVDDEEVPGLVGR